MINKTQLQNDLVSFNIAKNDTVLIHSSCKSIGPVEGGADTILDVFSSYFKEGLLVFPTHTWASVNKNNPYFYEDNTPCCTGILPELFRQREGVVRSLHPTHSVAALGKDAEVFIKDDVNATTPCPRNSSWGKLLDKNATIMLIGVTFGRNTFIHGVEEWRDIQNRVSNESYQVHRIDKYGKDTVKEMHPHVGSFSDKFDRILPSCIENGIVKEKKLGNSKVLYFKTQALAEFINQILDTNPGVFD